MKHLQLSTKNVSGVGAWLRRKMVASLCWELKVCGVRGVFKPTLYELEDSQLQNATYIYIYMYIWYGIYPCEVMSRGMWTIKWSSVGSRWAFLLPRRCFVMLCKLPLFHPEVIWRVTKHKVRKTISRQSVLIVLYHFMTHTMEPWFESTNKSSVNGKVWHFGQYTYSLSCWELWN